MLIKNKKAVIKKVLNETPLVICVGGHATGIDVQEGHFVYKSSSQSPGISQVKFRAQS